MEKNSNTQIDRNQLESTDSNPEVKEFVTRPTQNRRRRRKKKSFWRKYGLLVSTGVFLVIFVLAIILGIFVCKLPVITVVLIVIIETALTILLREVPLWSHILMVFVNILTGLVFQMTLFMVLGAIVYAAGVFVLFNLVKNGY